MSSGVKKFKTIHLKDRATGDVQRHTREKFNAQDRAIREQAANIETIVSEIEKTRVLGYESGGVLINITKTIGTGVTSTIATIDFQSNGNPVELFLTAAINCSFTSAITFKLELLRNGVVVSSNSMPVSHEISTVTLIDPSPLTEEVTYLLRGTSVVGSTQITNAHAFIREL